MRLVSRCVGCGVTSRVVGPLIMKERDTRVGVCRRAGEDSAPGGGRGRGLMAWLELGMGVGVRGARVAKGRQGGQGGLLLSKVSSWSISRVGHTAAVEGTGWREQGFIHSFKPS